MKKSVLRKVLAVALSATVLCGTGFTTVGQFVGTDVSVSAADVYGDFKYEMIDDYTVTITGYTGNGGDVTIPSTIDGKSVAEIDKSAFKDCKSLKSVVIPNSVTYIGPSAFSGCTGLTSITIPNSVTYIGNDAFSGCTGLTSITIPDSVTDIKDWAFYGCTGLKSITIPDSVTDIKDRAFYGCTGLKSITIPNSVTYIGNYAFHGCTGLTSITIPNSVTEIGGDAFLGCTGLRSVNIPDSVTEIAGWTFRGCENLRSIVIPDSVTKIGSYAFYSCTGMTSVTIGNGVTSIGDHAFNGCTDLTSITIPDSVTSIVDKAFCECTNLKSIVIPSSVTYIGDYALEGCPRLTIYGVKGSYAETYANDWGIPFATLATYIKGIAPTCTENGKKGYYHNDFDGKNYEDVECEKEIKDLKSWGNIPATGHKYTENVVAPTATAQGYTLHTCSVCGDSYKDNYTDKLLANNSVLSAETIKLGETITVTGKATGGTGTYLYQVVYKQKTQTKWTTAQPYSTTTSVSIKPAKAVTYDVCVKVKDSANTEVKNFYKVTVTDNRPKNLSTISSSSVELGDTVVVKAKASGSTGFFQYAVYYKKASDTKWICRQSFKAKSVITFAPSFAEPYDVCVKVKDDKGTVVKKYFNVDVIKPQDKLINASAISANDIKLGERITVFSSASGSTGFYQYAVSYRNSNNTNWITIQDYSSEDIVQVKPDSIGTYEICVKVKDNQNNVIEKYFTVTVK